MAQGSSDSEQTLTTLLEEQIPEAARSELAQLLTRRPLTAIPLLTYLSGAGRRAGSAEAQLSLEQLATLRGLGYAATERMPVAALLRSLVLVRGCAALEPEAQQEFVTRAYRTGSNEERWALLKTLPVLPAPERFVSIAQDACRSHVLDVFEAIACENPYPARHFDATSFHQLVMKALFVGSHLSRVVGLADRNNDELKRMVRDYAAERRAAGRPVPTDAALVEPRVEPSLETEP